MTYRYQSANERSAEAERAFNAARAQQVTSGGAFDFLLSQFRARYELAGSDDFDAEGKIVRELPNGNSE